MYFQYFGLTEAPFSIAPDPRYLYMSKRHQEALAHLLYGLRGDGGFVLLTGEVGAGKTTVCRCLLEQVPESCDVAYIFNPKLTAQELLATLCEEFGIACPRDNASIKVFVDCLNAHLLDAHARGRHTVLIIDEAQNLSGDVLEQMRLLTNLETNQRKLLQIILLGQPELVDMLERPELRQLSQRIVARYHLGPLNKEEVAAYLEHRLEVSGISAGTKRLFPKRLIGAIHRLSGGVPRLLNVLCDRALLGTYAQGKQRVDRATLMQAAQEVFPRRMASRQRSRHVAAGVLLAVIVLAAALTISREDGDRQHEATPGKSVASAAPVVVAAAKPDSDPLREAVAWPRHQVRADSRQMAMSALFRAWGVEYQGGDSCARVLGLGLECRSGRGSFAELRRLDRPAVLSLRDVSGKEPGFSATLLRLDDRSATVEVGGEVIKVAPVALVDQWSGKYLLLSRKAPRKGDKESAPLAEGNNPTLATPGRGP